MKQQWRIKQAFALDGDRQSRKLLGDALEGRGEPVASAVDVFNTSSWPRTDLVTLPKEMTAAGDVVKDASGRIVPSQRLSTGELVFLAKDVPPLAGRRYTIRQPGNGLPASRLGPSRRHDPDRRGGVDREGRSGHRRDRKPQGRPGRTGRSKGGRRTQSTTFISPVETSRTRSTTARCKIRIVERGPLVAALEITSEAPGCNRLVRQVRVVDGLDRVEIVNMVDKKAIRAKEGVHFGFGFHVPDGVVRMDIPWAVVRPEADQLPGACKNWFTVQRFVDISNDRSGVTWATVDAPLVEVGGLTGQSAGIAAEARVLPRPHRTLADDLLLGDEQPLVHQLQGRPGRPDDVPLRDSPARRRTTPARRSGSASSAASRWWLRRRGGRRRRERALLSVEPAGVIVTSIQARRGRKGARRPAVQRDRRRREGGGSQWRQRGRRPTSRSEPSTWRLGR